MGYQFIHVSSYGRSAGKGKEGGHCVRSILAEAGREEGAHPHVEAPQPPTVLHGLSLAEVEAEASAWAEGAKDARGHRLRKDGLCLLAGVISAPDDMSAEVWEALKVDAVDWLGRDGRLLSVIEHHDESHRHIHFFKTPAEGARFDSIHPGRAAAAAAKARGEVKGDQNKAYKEAMRGFQSDFFTQVGAKHGLTRIGPAKRRLTRSGWVAEQTAAKAMAEARKQAEAAQISAAAMIARAEETAKAALAEADRVAAEVVKAAKAREAAKAAAVRTIREKAAMDRVAAQVKADQVELAKAKRWGGKLGQIWGGVVDFATGAKAKAKREREAEAAKLAEAQAEAKRERDRAIAAEEAQKRAELRLGAAQEQHRKALAKAEAERVRAEMALSKHLAPPAHKQAPRGQRM
jgi:hypothetical protein